MSAHEAIGVDLGSRLTKVVRINSAGKILDAHVLDTGHDPLRRLRRILKRPAAQPVMATGYGRHLAQAELAYPTVTEIRACARAARHLSPDAASVIDVGGQDSKAIELPRQGEPCSRENLSLQGEFGRFEMNPRCAAGTGRFLEVMAAALGYSLEEFGAEALRADGPTPVTSKCTVFAESEVVSLIARGEDRRRIALGLHVAAAQRIAAMASRIELGRRTLFVGGVAKNPCMVKALGEELAGDLVAPDRPELAVALGAALIALDEAARNPPGP